MNKTAKVLHSPPDACMDPLHPATKLCGECKFFASVSDTGGAKRQIQQISTIFCCSPLAYFLYRASRD